MSRELLTIAAELALPPFSPFLLLLSALLLPAAWRWRRMALAAVAVAALWAFSTLGVAEWIHPAQPPPASIPAPPPADAIVVLGAGRNVPAPEYPGGETVSASSLERLRYGARLARRTGRPILLSGGRPFGLGVRSEAELMREVLEEDWGLRARWLESRSASTAENARESAAILRAEGLGRVYLVTHSIHMARAQALFEAEGIAVVPMPTVFVARESQSLRAWLPSFRGLARNRQWLFEHLARLSG